MLYSQQKCIGFEGGFLALINYLFVMFFLLAMTTSTPAHTQRATPAFQLISVGDTNVSMHVNVEIKYPERAPTELACKLHMDLLQLSLEISYMPGVSMPGTLRYNITVNAI